MVYGWEIEDGQLVHWLDQLLAPRQLMEFICCGCKKGCKTTRCSCKHDGLLCTDMSQCLDCSNCPDDLVQCVSRSDSDDSNID